MATSAQLLNQVQAKTEEQFRANEAAFIATQTEAAKAEELAKESARILREAAAAQSTIVRETDAAKSVVESAQRRAAQAIGYDPVTGTGQIFDRIKSVNDTGSKVLDLGKKLQAERSVSVLKDPLEWLKVNFLSNTEEELVQTSEQLQTESQVLQNLNAAVQQTAKTTEATAQTITAAKTEAAAKLAATDSQLRANAAEFEGIRARTAAVTARANLTKEDLNALHNLRSGVMAEQNYQLNLQQEERARQQFDFQKEIKRIADAEKKSDKDMEGYMIETINYGNKLSGRPEITGMDAKMMVQTLKKGGTDELNRLYHIGLSYRMNPQNPIIGPSPADAYDNIISLQMRLTDSQNKVVEVLRDVRQALPSTAYDPKTGKVNAKAYNDAVENTFNEYSRSIRSGSGNPFDIGDLAPHVTGLSQLQGLPLVQKVLMPAVTAKQPLSDPAKVIELAITAARKGEVTMPQIVDGISTIYQSANGINQTQSGFISMGIVPPKGGLTYNARLGFATTVNLLDPVEVGRYISQQMMAASRPQYQGMYMVGSPPPKGTK